MAGADRHGRRTPAQRERRLRPVPSGVDVWYARDAWLDDAHDAYARLLTPEEHARRARFMFARDRRQFLAARGMLRTLLSDYTGVPAGACVIETDRHGRPRLAGQSRIDFNLSHTRGMIAVAITGGLAVGVDVEGTARAWAPELPRRYFAPAEVEALEGLPPDARHARFYEIWTLKEAYVKARGLGLAIPLTEFAMQVDENGGASVSFDEGAGDRADRWQLHLETPDAGYRLAVAIAREGTDRPVVIRQFRPGGEMTT